MNPKPSTFTSIAITPHGYLDTKHPTPGLSINQAVDLRISLLFILIYDIIADIYLWRPSLVTIGGAILKCISKHIMGMDTTRDDIKWVSIQELTKSSSFSSFLFHLIGQMDGSASAGKDG